MENPEDAEYVEFFCVGDKVTYSEEFGIVVQTYELDERNVVVGGSLIVRWDTKDEADFENCSGNLEAFLRKADQNHQFKYINEDGTEKEL